MRILLSLSLNGGARRKAASPPCWDIATPGVKGSRPAAPEAQIGTDRGQRETRTALLDTERGCRNVEAAFGEMWRVSEAGEQPSSFSIELAPH